MRDSPHQRTGVGILKKCWLKDPKLDARGEKEKRNVEERQICRNGD